MSQPGLEPGSLQSTQRRLNQLSYGEPSHPPLYELCIYATPYPALCDKKMLSRNRDWNRGPYNQCNDALTNWATRLLQDLMVLVCICPVSNIFGDKITKCHNRELNSGPCNQCNDALTNWATRLLRNLMVLVCICPVANIFGDKITKCNNRESNSGPCNQCNDALTNWATENHPTHPYMSFVFMLHPIQPYVIKKCQVATGTGTGVLAINATTP